MLRENRTDLDQHLISLLRNSLSFWSSNIYLQYFSRSIFRHAIYYKVLFLWAKSSPLTKAGITKLTPPHMNQKDKLATFIYASLYDGGRWGRVTARKDFYLETGMRIRE